MIYMMVMTERRNFQKFLKLIYFIQICFGRTVFEDYKLFLEQRKQGDLLVTDDIKVPTIEKNK